MSQTEFPATYNSSQTHFEFVAGVAVVATSFNRLNESSGSGTQWKRWQKPSDSFFEFPSTFSRFLVAWVHSLVDFQ